VVTATRRRADVAPLDLDPRMGCLVVALFRKPDDEHCVITLLAQETEEDKRAEDARRAAIAETQASVHSAAEARR
jgi:hypothetical protein